MTLDVDWQQVLANCRSNGIKGIVGLTIDAGGWDGPLELCRSNAGLDPALGLHPVFANQHANPKGSEPADASSYWTTIRIPVDEVERVERAHFSGGKRAAAAGVGMLLILAIIAIATAGAFMP